MNLNSIFASLSFSSVIWVMELLWSILMLVCFSSALEKRLASMDVISKNLTGKVSSRFDGLLHVGPFFVKYLGAAGDAVYSDYVGVSPDLLLAFPTSVHVTVPPLQ